MPRTAEKKRKGIYKPILYDIIFIDTEAMSASVPARCHATSIPHESPPTKTYMTKV
jgi:hypothetical protein